MRWAERLSAVCRSVSRRASEVCPRSARGLTSQAFLFLSAAVTAAMGEEVFWLAGKRVEAKRVVFASILPLSRLSLSSAVLPYADGNGRKMQRFLCYLKLFPPLSLFTPYNERGGKEREKKRRKNRSLRNVLS